MQIKKAFIKDLEQVYSITKNCANHLIKNGIIQWSSNYPSIKILKNDIVLNQLWKLEEAGKIIGIIVLTEEEDLAYASVKWLTKKGKNLYVHRLAVHPTFQAMGYGQKLMDFAEAYAKKNKYVSIRLDTFSENERNQKFYEHRGYKKLSKVYFPNQSKAPFYCYEKQLNV